MIVHAITSNWRLDGKNGALFLVFLTLAAAGYLLAAAYGRHRDRRRRRWPLRRTVCFLCGLVLLVLDTCSGVGVQSDARLSMHTLEHMIIWVCVAPLIAAAAPMRLTLFGVPRARAVLPNILRTRAVRTTCGPIGSVLLFSVVLITAHVPAVYDLTLHNEDIHGIEHALFLGSAIVFWAPLVGSDPIPHRAGPRGRLFAMVACTVVMGGLAIWLAVASAPVYSVYAAAGGSSALGDQRLAAAIMCLASLPALGVTHLATLGLWSRSGREGASGTAMVTPRRTFPPRPPSTLR
jgi:cytochrome c oxidase assembly factor CtaG